MRKIIKTFLPVFCLTMLMAMQAFAADAVSFSGNGEMKEDVVTVTLTADESGACSGQVTLTYDPAVVELVKADYGNAVKPTEVKSLNEKAMDNKAIEMGFADLEAIKAGEILTADFKLIAELPKDGVVFHASVEEWSGAEKNDLKGEESVTEYDIVVKDDNSTVIPTPPGGGDKEDPNKDPNKDPNTDVSTGDTTPVLPVIIVLVICALALVIGAVVYSKKKNH